MAVNNFISPENYAGIVTSKVSDFGLHFGGRKVYK